ncbi:DUF6371 domain-containing protein [uncultured Alistipes sp.]|uniref:DUF6371 domain-containing protein n=2 Tax=Alistipes TaxID=239759 RepID=UPI0034A05F4A
MSPGETTYFSGMTRYNAPYLEPYKGRSSRHECPACHDKQSFARYLDGSTGAVIHPSVGRCNHESGCGYHYTPRQYFQDNPTRKEVCTPGVPGRTYRRPILPKEPDYIPKEYLARSLGYGSNFVTFLCSLFAPYTVESPTIARLMSDYYFGMTKDKSIIYWQIDEHNRIRTGKIMQYDPATGKRIKNTSGAIDWAHAKLKRDGILPGDFNLVQCLFGEHLLKRYPDKVVALVESEKSALIGAGVYPDYLWLATGGRSQLSIDKLRVLRGRAVVMFPDVDGYELWCEKAQSLETIGCKVIISDLLEKNASPADRVAKIDLADWLIRQLQASAPERSGCETEPMPAPALSLAAETKEHQQE